MNKDVFDRNTIITWVVGSLISTVILCVLLYFCVYSNASLLVEIGKAVITEETTAFELTMFSVILVFTLCFLLNGVNFMLLEYLNEKSVDIEKNKNGFSRKRRNKRKRKEA